MRSVAQPSSPELSEHPPVPTRFVDRPDSVQPLWVCRLVLVFALVSVLGGGETSEAAVGSPAIVFVPPVFDNDS